MPTTRTRMKTPASTCFWIELKMADCCYCASW
jgi:hypothetical protein